MGNEDENLFICLQLFFQPDAAFKIEMIGRLVEEKKVRLDVERSG